MELILDNVAKRFRFDWIFKRINLQFKTGQSYALTGPNGSGKSTFLKILSGHLSPSKGSIQFLLDNQKISIDDIYKQVSYAAPYIELIEEMTLKEAIIFHQQFKPFVNNLKWEDIVEILDFGNALDRELRFFSSGMKQRLKLVLAICSESQILLLDEPTTNLDQQGAIWYKQLITKYQKDRILVVASNVEADMDFCKARISILDYK